MSRHAARPDSDREALLRLVAEAKPGRGAHRAEVVNVRRFVAAAEHSNVTVLPSQQTGRQS